MKKLMIVFLMVLGLGACSPTQEPYNDKEVKDSIVDIETRLDLIETELEQIQVIRDIVNGIETVVSNIELYDDHLVYEELTQLQMKLETLQELHTFDINVLIVEIDLLESEIQALNDRIENLTVTTGLNGQTSVYENKILGYSGIAKMIAQVQYMKDTFDKNKAPSYIVDLNGDYVSFNQLSSLLKVKYFSDEASDMDYYFMGAKSYIQMGFTDTYDINDIFARTVLLVEELRNYPFYIISSSEVVLYINNGNNVLKLTIPLVTMLNDYFEITLEGIFANDYEMRLENAVIDLAVAQSYYDFYISQQTFSGYVLDWE